MTLDDLFVLARRAHELSGHRDYVIVGSLSVLGLSEHTGIPQEMSMSNDIDAYAKSDPERTFDLIGAMGETSEFYDRHSFYLDPVTPKLLTLPEGWEARMNRIERDGVALWFLDPNDAAIAKYARSDPRDLRWIRAGARAGIVSLPMVRARLPATLFLDLDEERRVRNQVEADAAWLEELSTARKFKPR